MKKGLPALIVLCAFGGCTANRAYFLPGRMALSPLDMTPAEVVPLTDSAPPGGPAFLAVSSGGMTKAPAPDGRVVALLHVKFSFRNRTGLEVEFDPAKTKAVVFLGGNAPRPLALEPMWVNEWGEVHDNTVPAGGTGGFDAYYAAAPPGILSAVGGFNVEWSYRLGEEEVAGSTVFHRTRASYYYAASGLPVEYGYYDRHSVYAGPSFFWLWPTVVMPSGGGGGGGASWIRR